MFEVSVVVVLFANLCAIHCDAMVYNPPGSSVHRISQARKLEQLPLPSQGDPPDPGIKTTFPALAGGFYTTEPPREPVFDIWVSLKNMVYL